MTLRPSANWIARRKNLSADGSPPGGQRASGNGHSFALSRGAVLCRRRPRVKPILAGWAPMPVMAMAVASVRAMIAASGAILGNSLNRSPYLPGVLASGSGCCLRTE